jgi:phenylpropionate dioxygenase-like ring-hydroxylating dioxygenase large terminal subunit
MLSTLKHRWFPLLSSSELKKNKIVEKRFFDKDVIVYKAPNDKVFVKSRYCPHRNADMKLGFISESCVICPYHGWEFDNNNGFITNIPACDTKNIHNIGLDHYYTFDDDTTIWCYFGNDESCPIQKPKVEKFNNLHITTGFRIMHCNWMRVIENSIDPSHPNFVHSNSFSSKKITSVKYIQKPILSDHSIDSIVQIYHESSIPFFDSDGLINIHFKIDLPNTVLISFKRRNNNILTIVTAVPITETETLVYWQFGQDFLYSKLLVWLIDKIITREMNKVLDEDQAILDSLKDNNEEFIYTHADLLQLRYHKVIKKEFKDSITGN